MKELLEEQLKEYESQYDKIQKECQRLQEQNEPWKPTADKAAGLKMLIKECKEQIQNYK